jgi:hypothetical protein
MSKGIIGSDARITDVRETLSNAEKYVCQILSKMSELRKEHGAVTVRIGILGQGRAPHYRMDYLTTGAPIEAFDGPLGLPFKDYKTIDTANWSTSSMTFIEVQQLLGDIRGHKPKKR